MSKPTTSTDEHALPKVDPPPPVAPPLTFDEWLEAACAKMATLDKDPERLAALSRRGF